MELLITGCGHGTSRVTVPKVVPKFYRAQLQDIDGIL